MTVKQTILEVLAESIPEIRHKKVEETLEAYRILVLGRTLQQEILQYIDREGNIQKSELEKSIAKLHDRINTSRYIVTWKYVRLLIEDIHKYGIENIKNILPPYIFKYCGSLI